MAAATTDSNAKSSSNSSDSFSVKLIIDKKEQRVLCAEAGKDFVDFLFNFLAMPVGAVARLLATDDHATTTMAAAGCVGELYNSARNMNEAFFQSVESKDYLVTKIQPETNVGTKVALLPIRPKPSSVRWIYRDNHNNNKYYTVPPKGSSYTLYLNFTDTAEGHWSSVREGDFVKGIVTYLVMDDLTVSPLESMMSGVSLLAKFGIKDLGAVEERDVQVGINEGLELLRAFMHTKSALTTVFLGKRGDTIVKKESN